MRLILALIAAAGVVAGSHAQQAATDLPSALDRFERGDWSAPDARRMTPDELRGVLRTFREHAPEWIAADGAGHQRRRRLVVATFVLQILEAQRDPFLWLGGGAAIPTYSAPTSPAVRRAPAYRSPLPAAELLAWTADFLKGDPPLAAERYWHLSVIGLLERGRAVDALNVEIDRAHSRFPSEERWVLARAISQEYTTWPESRDVVRFEPPPMVALPIEDRYRDAIQKPSVSAEAQLRLGYFELRRGRVDLAITHFGAVGTPADAMLLYWLRLFEGEASEQKGDWKTAIDAYQGAFDAVPYAQSASLALAAALAQAHRAQEAAALTEKTLAVPQPPFDPWVLYTLPDMRFWDHAQAILHAAIQRQP
jgi:tetratricopeptide (TPR) repeat protein